MIIEFPPVELADPESGLLAVGGDLEVGSLELAYRSGIFPWPAREDQILWFAPPQRAILDFDDLHIPRRMQRHLKSNRFSFRINHNFEAVIHHCANSKNRGKGQGTWITRQMLNTYIEFHHAGFAHSFETYNQSGKIAGGLYGVRIGNYFAGESMFYFEPNASKFALLKAIEYFREEGFTWIDIQMLTPLLENLGAKEIPRKTFMKRLKTTIGEE